MLFQQHNFVSDLSVLGCQFDEIYAFGQTATVSIITRPSNDCVIGDVCIFSD